jgi:hypothetical protein
MKTTKEKGIGVMLLGSQRFGGKKGMLKFRDGDYYE